MNLFKPKQPSAQPPSMRNPFSSENLQVALDHVLSNLQTRFSNVIRIPQLSISNPFFNNSSLTDIKNSIFTPLNKTKNLALSAAEIKKRMAGIPIYAVIDNSQSRMCVVSDTEWDRQVQFYFVSKADAENFVQTSEFHGNTDLQIFDLPLTDVVDYEGKGASIRLVPELSQVNNAVEEAKKDSAHFPDYTFSGVPVFQSENLRLECNEYPNTSYSLAFLRKEDLENCLTIRAPKGSEDTHTIQVAGLEDIIQEMKDSSTSKWNDVVFVAPGITSWTWIDRSIFIQ